MTIAYGRHSVDQSDVDAVVRVLRSDYLTQGPVVPEFERALATTTGNKFAVAVNSATSALHLACLALGVRPGDEVWTSPITFVASANCAFYCGGTVDYIDIDRSTFNMDPNRLEDSLKAAAKKNRLPRVVIPVHLAGLPCAMPEIAAVCRRFDVRVLQDASHALGATVGGVPVMADQFGDISVTSFHPVKMVTTAEGGAAVTSDRLLAASMERLRSHGITRASEEMQTPPPGPWYYEQLELGFNYRMPDFFAALGLSQLQRLEQFVIRRNEVAQMYRERLSDRQFNMQKSIDGVRSSHHLVVIAPEKEVTNGTQQQNLERLRARGVMTTVHYIPVYRHPFHRQRLIRQPDCPVAEWYYSRALTLPCYPEMSDADVDTVIGALIEPVGHQTIF